MNDRERYALVLRYGLDGGHEGGRTDEETARAMGNALEPTRKLLASARKALDLGKDDATALEIANALNAYDNDPTSARPALIPAGAGHDRAHPVEEHDDAAEMRARGDHAVARRHFEAGLPAAEGQPSAPQRPAEQPDDKPLPVQHPKEPSSASRADKPEAPAPAASPKSDPPAPSKESARAADDKADKDKK